MKLKEKLPKQRKRLFKTHVFTKSARLSGTAESAGDAMIVFRKVSIVCCIRFSDDHGVTETSNEESQTLSKSQNSPAFVF